MRTIRLYAVPLAIVTVLMIGGTDSAHAITVTSPAPGAVVASGDDYASRLLANSWDMSDALDFHTQDSSDVTAQAFNAGVYSATTTGNLPTLYPLFMGYIGAINLSQGADTPIDTSHYRYVTVKLKADQPGGHPQFSQIGFYKDRNAISNQELGETFFSSQLPNNQWVILSFDMINDNDGIRHQWLDYPLVRGLSILPTYSTAPGGFLGVHLSIDWIRLTAPATNAERTSVQWTDSGYSGTYVLAATDSDGTLFTLASGVNGTSYAADLTFLEPGQYTITVARSDSSATPGVSGQFRINKTPQLQIDKPNVAGEQPQEFAATQLLNPWGPFSAQDFSTNGSSLNGAINFVAGSISYTTYPGSFYARPKNNDPAWFFNLAGSTINADVYRSLCFDLEVFGQRSLGGGSVARIFWGNSLGALTTSEPVVLDDNAGGTIVSRYCIADLATVDPEVGTPVSGGIWSGTKSVFRIDPDEFTPPNGCSTPQTCHDVRLDSVTLSPFAQANPGYTFQWSLADPDNVADSVSVYLDPDKTPLNGNEILIHSGNTPTGSGSFAWAGSTSANYGTYQVLLVADDGLNSVSQYAGGPLVVGARDGIFRNGFDSLL